METHPNTDQPELALRVAAPEVSEEEVAAVLCWLRGRGWVKAREIEAALGIDERKLRALAEHSDGEILSGPGCPGYRRFDRETSLGDADRAAARLESQGRKMLLRAGSIRRRLHRYARA